MLDFNPFSSTKNVFAYLFLNFSSCKQIRFLFSYQSVNTIGYIIVKFTGLIANIDSDGDYISVKGQERFAIFSSFHCSLKDKKQKEVVMNKNQGSKVTIKGKITDVGEVLGYRVKVDEIQ